MTCSGSTNTRAVQADEARMELAACKSELACSTSLWEKKRQEMSAQLNKYKSRCSALERKRSSDISGLAHDVNCLQRSVRQALTQLARVKSARDSYPLPTPPRPLGTAVSNVKLSSTSLSSAAAAKKKAGAGAAGARGAPARTRPMSASPVNGQEREEEEWKQEVAARHLARILSLTVDLFAGGAAAERGDAGAARGAQQRARAAGPSHAYFPPFA